MIGGIYIIVIAIAVVPACERLFWFRQDRKLRRSENKRVGRCLAGWNEAGLFGGPEADERRNKQESEHQVIDQQAS
jgi:hypothetical protein